jgi:sucrose-phosphate synthase
VIHRITNLVDDFDLYGSVAYPKQIRGDLAPALYRLAARTGGVFVNPALTEPFGLTLLEAAANGLPVVATSDGGPRDILRVCQNGELVDPFDSVRMGELILDAVRNRTEWTRKSGNAKKGVVHFSWKTHAQRYVEVIEDVLQGERPTAVVAGRSRLPRMDRALISDLDGTLTGDDTALDRLLDRIHRVGESTAFGVVTGRTMEECRRTLDRLPIRRLDFLITDSGTEIYYGWPNAERDLSWSRHIAHHWKPQRIREALDEIEEIVPLSLEESGVARIACRADPDRPPSLAFLQRHLRKRGLRATILFDSRTRVDILPIRASPGLALRFLEFKLNLAPERTLVAGDSGNDVDMLAGNTLGVVVANHVPEIGHLRSAPRIYFAETAHAEGILEGIDYYDFFGSIRIPEEEERKQGGGREEEEDEERRSAPSDR